MLNTMFNSIQGIVSAKGSEALYLFSGDIEWDIAMPSSDIQGYALNSECRVFTWLYHREDQMRLYGFASERRRATFLELLKVEGIGPKGAIKILGGISQEELEKALENGDLARLEAVPGLGKKTAQKMLLALKGKLISVQETSSANTPYNDLVEALASMGYDRRTAVEALAKSDAVIDAVITGVEREKLLFKEAIVYLTMRN
jgi:Holliday junction DNA helicase RuvA